MMIFDFRVNGFKWGEIAIIKILKWWNLTTLKVSKSMQLKWILYEQTS